MHFPIFMLSFVILLVSCKSNESIFELSPNQSMSITGKGPGQDAAVNPYSGTNSIGVVENIGGKAFVVRIQKGENILEMTAIQPNQMIEFELLEGYELYFDSDYKTKDKVNFKKSPDPS